MRKTINIFLIIIGINVILSLSVFFYHEQKPEKVQEKNYSYINNWQINYDKVDFSNLILNSIKINDVNINPNEEYDVSMFIKKYNEYKNIKFEILNKETYKDSGKYKIKIKAHFNDSSIIKTAYLTINEEKQDNVEVVDIPVEQPIINNYTPVVQTPVIQTPTTSQNTTTNEQKQEVINNQNNNQSTNNNQNTTSNNETTNNNNQNNSENNNQNNQENETNQEQNTQPEVTEPPVVDEPNPITGTYNDAYAYQVFNMVNIIRRENNLPELTWDTTLVNNAKTRAYEASVSFSHTRPDGSAFYTAFTNIIYPVGENLAIGYLTPQAVVDGWMASESHKANILDPGYTKIGISMYQVNGTNYWSQLFTG